MSGKKLELLREEAVRLLGLQATLLEEMHSAPNVITALEEGEHQTFDRSSTLKRVEVVRGELAKLENLDLVLAVVGTMKAGKSTTINAIVGSEVLPSRNRAMTALPTLIRHTPGQLEPELKFHNREPVNSLLRQIAKLAKKGPGKKRLEAFAAGQDIADILEMLDRGTDFPASCRGEEEIFGFLRRLNDVVRLASLLELEFPFDSYDEVHEMPVIEVEFSHLRGMEDVTGRLTLLDTPGPNEAGQPHLRRMLTEQLGKASAILAVMDFTQLKTDADEQLRLELEGIATMAKGRLHLLVNKFDERDRNSDTEETVRMFVSNNLMRGQVGIEDIYPVSSREGFLANRAKHELEMHGHLPEPAGRACWVQDFGEEAFGKSWRTRVREKAELHQGAEDLWESSGFARPLEQVVQAAHARGAVLAIDSAVAKLVVISEEMQAFLALRHSALKRNSQGVRQQIDALRKDMAAIAELEKEAKKVTRDAVRRFAKRNAQLFEEIQSISLEELKGFFREGRKLETQELAVMSAMKPPVAGKQLGSEAITSQRQKHKFFDPKQPRVRLENQRQAGRLLHHVETSVGAEVARAERRINEEIGLALAGFQKEFEADVMQRVAAIMAGLNKRLEEADLVASLDLPRLKKQRIAFSPTSTLDALVDERHEARSYKARSSSIWGRLCGFFNTDDFGFESRVVSESYYEVDLRKVEAAVLREVGVAFTRLQESCGLYVEDVLASGSDKFFVEFRAKLEHLGGDLQQSLRDHEHGHAEQKALSEQLARLMKKLPTSDVHDLKSDLAPLMEWDAEVAVCAA